MNGFSFRLTSVLFLLTSLGMAKAQIWIPFDTQESETNISAEIIQSDATGYKVRVIVHGLSDCLVTNEDGDFHRISFGGDNYLSTIGEPSLPVFSQLIAIPTGAQLSAMITDDQWTDVEIGRIYPTQKALLGTERPTGFDYVEGAYSNSYMPTLLRVGQTMQWRDIRNTSVSVCPFKYYPQENRLSVMTQFVLQVSFTYDGERRVRSFTKADDPYCLFDNIPHTEDSQTESQCDSGTALSRMNNSYYYNYLIIVGDVPGVLNSEKMKEFRRWKAMKGYKTKVASIDTIGNYPLAIKNFISGEYEKGVRYVLFVGDYEMINSAYIYTSRNRYVYSDYWYGCLVGDDLEAEIPIGRFSVETFAQFVNIVDKTIKYESKYDSSNEVLLVANAAGAPNSTSFQACCNQIYATHNNDMTFIKAYGACDTIGNNATNASVVAEINNGAHIVNYRGHGSPAFWGGGNEADSTVWNCAGESFTISQINNMNSETCAIFFSVACLTGRIVEDSCMLESFTRSNHGAVAFVGATETTIHGVNNSYNKLLFNKLLSENECHLGDLNVSAHITNLQNQSPNPDLLPEYFEDNPFCYICGGDPALELWTATPQTMNVDWDFANGYATITTNLTGNYYVTVTAMNGDRLDSIACSNSVCTFPIPTNQSKFYITVNKHNYYPHVIFYDSVTDEIINETYDYDAYYTATPLHILCGYNPAIEEGTRVKSGHKLRIRNGYNGVEIWENFEVEEGAVFEIK